MEGNEEVNKEVAREWRGVVASDTRMTTSVEAEEET
jgi:hypothetical protein